jgi:hypothetical protein
MGAEDAYGGLLGAFPYAVRRSRSWTFRLYAVLAGLGGALLVVFLVLAMVVWVAATIGAPASVTLSRSFLVVVGLLLFAPLVTPVLLVARRHRRSGAATRRYEFLLGVCGFLFVVGCYAGLLVAIPADARGEPAGPLAPLARVLYALPRPAAAGPPLVPVALMALVERFVGAR